MTWRALQGAYLRHPLTENAAVTQKLHSICILSRRCDTLELPAYVAQLRA